MIKFNADNLTIDTLHVVRVVGGQHASIHHMDDTGTIIKTKIPFGVASSFQKEMKTSTFLNPVACSYVNYDGQGLALINQTPLTQVETSVNKFVENIKAIPNVEIFFDGNSAYCVPKSLVDNPHTHNAVEAYASIQCDFSNVEVQSFNLRGFNKGDITVAQSNCLLYRHAESGAVVIMPPVIKHNLDMDHLDNNKFVTLAFMLGCLNKLSQVWGDGVVEFVNLPALMVQLNTVNLPNLPRALKSTTSCGMSMREATIWLAGFCHRAENLEELVVVRKQLRLLLSGKGLVDKQVFAHDTIYVDGCDANSLQLADLSELRRTGSKVAA